MARSPRAGARREVLRRLRTIRISVDTMKGWWDCTSTVYVPDAERAPGSNAYLRAREAGEYPENQRLYWAGTVNAIDKLQAELTNLRAHCLEELDKTREGG